MATKTLNSNSTAEEVVEALKELSVEQGGFFSRMRLLHSEETDFDLIEIFPVSEDSLTMITHPEKYSYLKINK